MKLLKKRHKNNSGHLETPKSQTSTPKFMQKSSKDPPRMKA